MNSLLIILAVFANFSTLLCEPEIPLMTTFSKQKLSEDGKLNFTQLVRKYGYEVEQHDVITDDGYILTLFRIPGEKGPVLLSHGLSAYADSWIVRTHKSLGMALADKGYDVWFANNRGTAHSRRHVTLDPDHDKQFWNFTFHEMGYYDLASSIDFVSEHTGGAKVLSIGHSQGCTQHFGLLSTRPEYNDKLKVFVALAPAVYFTDMPDSFRSIADAGPLLIDIVEALGIEEIFRDNGVINDLIRIICTQDINSYTLCANVLLSPFDGSKEDFEFLSTLLGHAFSGASMKSYKHFDQLYLSQKFQQFDNGVPENLQRYGCAAPPEYDMSKVTVDTAIVAGTLDTVATTNNTRIVAERLPHVIEYKEVPLQRNDFIWNKKAPQTYFQIVFDILDKCD